MSDEELPDDPDDIPDGHTVKVTGQGYLVIWDYLRWLWDDSELHEKKGEKCFCDLYVAALGAAVFKAQHDRWPTEAELEVLIDVR